MGLKITRWMGAAALAAAASGIAAEGPERPTARLSIDADTLHLDVAVPRGCWPMEFMLPAAAGVDRGAWRFEGCAALKGDQVQPVTMDCAQLRLDVPIAPTFADRVDPPATPIAEAGSWVNTSALRLATSACGPVRWHVDAAPGTELVVRGTGVGSTWDEPPGQLGYLPAAIFQGRTGETMLVVGATVGNARRQQVESTLDQLRALFRPLASNAAAPFVAVSQFGPLRGRATFQAGAPDDRMIQLQIFEEKHGPQRDLLGQIRTVLAHEWVHLLAPRDAGRWSALVREGHAEAGRLWAASALGWMDDAAVAEEIARMADACLLSIGVGPMKDDGILGRGRAPYDCGGVLAVSRAHTLVVAGRPWLSVLSEACEQPTCLFAQVESAANARAGMGMAISSALQAAQLPIRARAITDAEATRLRTAMFSSWMREDCRKSVGFETLAGSLRISRIRSCATYREGMEIVAADDRPLFGSNLLSNLEHLALTCRERANISLQLSDGRHIVVPCSDSLVPPTSLFEVDPSAVTRLGAVWHRN